MCLIRVEASGKTRSADPYTDLLELSTYVCQSDATRTGFNVIKSVRNTIYAIEKFFVIDVLVTFSAAYNGHPDKGTFGGRAHRILPSVNFPCQVWIHIGYRACCHLRFELSEILGPEKKLAVKVAFLDRVQVGNMNQSLEARA